MKEIIAKFIINQGEPLDCKIMIKLVFFRFGLFKIGLSGLEMPLIPPPPPLLKTFRQTSSLGSISAVSRVRSLILPEKRGEPALIPSFGGRVRAHFPEQRLVIEPTSSRARSWPTKKFRLCCGLENP